MALEQLHCFFLSRIVLVQIAQKHLLVFFANQIAQQVLNVKLVLVFVGICELLIPLDHLFELQIELLSELELGFEHVFAHLAILVNQLVLKQKHLLLNEAVFGFLQLVLRNQASLILSFQLQQVVQLLLEDLKALIESRDLVNIC